MKILWLLGCAFSIGACGGGDSTTNYSNGRSQPAPTIVSQTPQVPSDSVPPTNPQLPASNGQAPSMNSQSPSSTGTASITCAQAFAVLRAAGCGVTQDDQAQCEAAVVPGAPCFDELQALFRCYMNYVACDDSGHLIDATTCDNETTAVDSCEGAHSQSPPPANPTGCTSAGGCNCANDCDSCRCLAIDTPSLSSTCDTICSATN